MRKNFYYLTTFPEIIEAYFNYSIPNRALSEGLIDAKAINLRDFTSDKHRTTDDSPFGGGPGMVMKIQPIWSALESLNLTKETAIILPTPKGQLLTQSLLKELSQKEQFVFLCGHYEGIDERIGLYAHYAVSLGNYVIGGGEIASLVLTDGILRLIKDVLGNEASILEDSFEKGLLDHPQFTKPRIFDQFPVPEVLTSGHHKHIELYRRKECLKWTLLLRPELLKDATLNDKDYEMLHEIIHEIQQSFLDLRK